MVDKAIGQADAHEIYGATGIFKHPGDFGPGTAPGNIAFDPAAQGVRRDQWDDREAVFQHFRGKKLFAAWDEQVLHDYVNHGTLDAEGTWQLAFDREVESRIYDTLPHNIGTLLRAQPLKCPLAFIGGLQSAEMKQVGGLENTARIAKGRVMMIDGSHLFPMEKPLATAAAVEASLRGLN